LAETTVSTTNWAELRAFATLLCRSQRGRKVRTFNGYLRMEQGSEPGALGSRAGFDLASEPGALIRNSYRFAGEGLTSSGSVRTQVKPPEVLGKLPISILTGHEIHGELALGGDQNRIKEEVILYMANEQ
jgi:hypothetical protein